MGDRPGIHRKIAGETSGNRITSASVPSSNRQGVLSDSRSRGKTQELTSSPGGRSSSPWIWTECHHSYGNGFRDSCTDQRRLSFHDPGKAEYPGKPQLCPTATGGKSRSKVSLIGNRIDLTEDEARGVVSHDGMFLVSGGFNDLDYHDRECRLQMIVQFADKWSGAVDRDGRSVGWNPYHTTMHTVDKLYAVMEN